MKVKYLNVNEIPVLGEEHALIIGTFDGVHAGHLALIERAKKENLIPVVLLIYTTTKIIKAHQHFGFITTLDDRAILFENAGVDQLFYLNLELELLNMEPVLFIEKVLNKFKVKAIIIGEDFRYGKHARGDIDLLKKHANSTTDIITISPIIFKDQPISTRAIKEKLSAGKLWDAKRMLGRAYTLSGLVVRGYGVGNELGYPTANIMLDSQYFLPRHGVYLVSSIVRGKRHFGMASLGFHPTINQLSAPLLEVYFFDFSGSLYHQTLEIKFHYFLRDEVKFNSREELVAQIDQDRARSLLIIKEQYNGSI